MPTSEWERPPFKVTPATLDVLNALADGSHKYAREIAQETGRAPGSVTTILARLRVRGWACAAWDTDDANRPGPRRRFFWIEDEHLPEVQELLFAHRPPPRRDAAPFVEVDESGERDLWDLFACPCPAGLPQV